MSQVSSIMGHGSGAEGLETRTLDLGSGSLGAIAGSGSNWLEGVGPMLGGGRASDLGWVMVW